MAVLVASSFQSSYLRVSSDDGVTWANTSPASLSNNPARFIYRAGLYLCLQGGVVSTSTDGANWTARLTNSRAYMGLGWNGTQYVVVGDFGSGGVTNKSTDGITWDGGASVSGLAAQMTCPSWDGARWLASSAIDGKLYTSTDAVTWTLFYTPSVAAAYGTTSCTASYGGVTVYAANTRLIRVQGSTVSEQTAVAPGFSTSDNYFYDGTQFVGYSSSAIVYSPDGTTWTTSSGGFGATTMTRIAGVYYFAVPDTPPTAKIYMSSDLTSRTLVSTTSFLPRNFLREASPIAPVGNVAGIILPALLASGGSSYTSRSLFWTGFRKTYEAA